MTIFSVTVLNPPPYAGTNLVCSARSSSEAVREMVAILEDEHAMPERTALEVRVEHLNPDKAR